MVWSVASSLTTSSAALMAHASRMLVVDAEKASRASLVLRPRRRMTPPALQTPVRMAWNVASSLTTSSAALMAHASPMSVVVAEKVSRASWVLKPRPRMTPPALRTPVRMVWSVASSLTTSSAALMAHASRMLVVDAEKASRASLVLRPRRRMTPPALQTPVRMAWNVASSLTTSSAALMAHASPMSVVVAEKASRASWVLRPRPRMMPPALRTPVKMV